MRKHTRKFKFDRTSTLFESGSQARMVIAALLKQGYTVLQDPLGVREIPKWVAALAGDEHSFRTDWKYETPEAIRIFPGGKIQCGWPRDHEYLHKERDAVRARWLAVADGRLTFTPGTFSVRAGGTLSFHPTGIPYFALSARGEGKTVARYLQQARVEGLDMATYGGKLTEHAVQATARDQLVWPGKPIELQQSVIPAPTSGVYTFSVSHIEAIDFDAIASELDREHPIAFVQGDGDEYNYVVVHDAFIHKARACGIIRDLPSFDGPVAGTVRAEVYRLPSRAWIGTWTKWARAVRAHPWPKCGKHGNRKFTVRKLEV